MTAQPADPRLGQIVDGKYRIVRLLGQGGMGAVYEARHELIGRRFAIKFLLPELAIHSQILERFRREAQAAGALENENIAAVTDFGQCADGAPYIVMEFLVGEDLSRLLAREGPLPVPRVIEAVIQACRGLQAAHDQGIVHRDLKPENLFVIQHGDGSDLIKVLDFGIAKLKREGDSSSSTRTGMALGTPFYMPREQARGQKDLDARADVYALGVILYELLSGKKPFDGEGYNEILYKILTCSATPLATLRPDLSAPLVSVVEKAMAPEPAQRFQSVRELTQALAPLLESLSMPPPAPIIEPGRSRSPTVHPQLLGTAPGASATVPLPSASPRSGAKRALVAVVGVSVLLAAVVGASLRRSHYDEPATGTRAAAALPVSIVATAAPSQHPAIAQALALASATTPAPAPSAANPSAPVTTSARRSTPASHVPSASPHHAARPIDPYAP